MEENWNTCLPIHALTDIGCEGKETTPRDIIAAADIIIGRDIMTQHTFCVYGRGLLTEIANGGEVNANVLMVELDQPTSELEYLLAAVQVVKGKDEYQDAGSDSWHLGIF